MFKMYTNKPSYMYIYIYLLEHRLSHVVVMSSVQASMTSMSSSPALSSYISPSLSLCCADSRTQSWPESLAHGKKARLRESASIMIVVELDDKLVVSLLACSFLILFCRLLVVLREQQSNWVSCFEFCIIKQDMSRKNVNCDNRLINYCTWLKVSGCTKGTIDEFSCENENWSKLNI